MKITKHQRSGGVDIIYFDTDERVDIRRSEGDWEYQRGDDNDSYMSGDFWVDSGAVIDYDGCFELPEAVRQALALFYDLDDIS